ncbi:MAG: single-stranded-DNA-specific exonuclease RecJ [Burkholderiaceae bacterium]|nr:single-stranded-DNA-specific exonuclease RecJ [Burkholderiaceae bacterium]MCD8516764.1 single-stranded-DNA-specific exonuclease RecJ [Burkholderiaceae bacterium]MCD8536655.1 single-stranded-DNA-specific exonuclease RecJ [Burkholderiaceae bacterium]MCD8564405.1 single-stranded-DNA-specific exonuclease RecJ [Burkholderiaceae bacterium]
MEKLVAQPELIVRPVPHDVAQRLANEGVHPLLARLMAARGVSDTSELNTDWQGLITPNRLNHIEEASEAMAQAIEDGKKLLIVADYDCDGATACAVGLRGLRALGAKVEYLVPNRFETGYGLSPEVVELAARHHAGKPDLIVTVDNGIASVDGVIAAKDHGIDVIITDHHLPGDRLPPALAIVNPNQVGCGFPSKNLAGVGVMFYVLMALRATLRARGYFINKPEPRLDGLVDLVALGTIADVVKLDANNRLLVTRGLQRIRAGQMQPGLRALFAVCGRDPAQASAFDFGFTIGPRINAAGRLTDMSLGIECLSTDDEQYALELARELDRINQERRQIEVTMREQAMASMSDIDTDADTGESRAAICVYQPDWHQGVVGLVASRLKEKFWRPVVALAPAGDGTWRGSGRSIPDVHLRDVFDLVSKRNPGLIHKFGGHAMAAGLTLPEQGLEAFAKGFSDAVIEMTGKTQFSARIETDGSLETGWANVQTATLLQEQVWGAGFPAPLFLDEFQVQNQRLVGGKHLKLSLMRDRQRFDAIWFNREEPVPERIQAVYRPTPNVWQSNISLQLVIETAQAA